MKRYLLFFVLIMTAVVGCQKLELEINPVLSKEQLEKDFLNVKAMLTSIYTDLPDGLFYIYGGSGAAMLAAASDEAEFTYENNAIQSFNTGSWNSVNNPDPAWSNYFRGIRKVNQFLVSKDSINLDYWRLNPEESSQTIYQQNKAEIIRWGYEARLLRAFFYFELVKRFGGVPIFTSFYNLDDDFKDAKRNTLEECINFIVNECDSAALHLPLTAYTYPYNGNADLGRVTQLFAMGLKSRVLLYAASDLFNDPSWADGYAHNDLISLPAMDRAIRWGKAAEASKELIDMMDVNLEYYKNLYTWNVMWSNEILFSKRYPESNDFEVYNSPIGYPRGQSGNTPSQNLVDDYEVLVGGVAKEFDWNNPTMAANPYANRDPRLQMAIVVNDEWTGPLWRKAEMWEGGLDAKPIANATKTGYYLGKYVNQDIDIAKGNTFIHAWILVRMPEIFLNYIEALNEITPEHPDIKLYYDKIRTRAEMPGLPSGLSQDEVRERIRRERRVELAFEEHRIWDVRRWMIAPQTLGVPLRAVRIVKNNDGEFSYIPYDLEKRVFEKKMYLYPIPQTDIIINPNLIQNPLW